MTTQEIMASADDRIRQHRTADATLYLADEAGHPIANATVEVELINHEFKFGCTGFLMSGIKDKDVGNVCAERFTDLLNYTTLPFYWGGYETSPGETSEQRLHEMAAKCRAYNLTAKGHPLVWHEVFPEWAEGLSKAEVLKRLEDRVKEIVFRFKGEIDIWDVVNEATVYHEQDNTISRWMGSEGPAQCSEKALRWAHEANPSATLLYNDFNVSDEFEALVETLYEHTAPVNVIGIQSHMHKGRWPLERVWQICETYGRFGWPLHWTEMTVLSGRLKAQDDNEWHKEHTDWKSTPEGEQVQAEYVSQVYTLLYSHPAVEAITWWDFSDYATWQGAPSGLLKADMSPKPLYDRLLHLVKTAWKTDERTASDEAGEARVRCTFGAHRVRATLASGHAVTGEFTLHRGGERNIDVVVA